MKKSIILLLLFCLSLFFIRIEVTGSLFFGFLIWNLLLATIPLMISEALKANYKKLVKWKLLIFIGIWILFLPNSAYIVTDFVHLTNEKSTLIWFDLFLIFTYALTGVLFTLLSINHISTIFIKIWNKKIAAIFTFCIVFLCGLGIYLGRFLRFNSWDIFIKPTFVLKKMIWSFTDVTLWFITFSFGSLLFILLLLLKEFTTTAKEF